MALHDTGELTCPRCGHGLEDEPTSEIPPEEGPIGQDQFRVHFDCPTCEAPLAIVIESALPEAMGVDIWVEDRE